MFSFCPPPGRWDVPHFHPIILPLDPCPFWGRGTPVTGLRSLPEGGGILESQVGSTPVPNDGGWGFYPPASTGCGTTPCPGWGVHPPSQYGMAPPPTQDRMEYPLPLRPGQDGVPSPPRTRAAIHGYVHIDRLRY